MEVLIAPLRDAACRNLRRFHQQETQQRVALFRDVSQPSSIPARFLQRHQTQIAGDLLAALKTITYENGEKRLVPQQEAIRVSLAEIYKNSQMMIGEAISVSELNAFIKEKKKDLACGPRSKDAAH